MKRKSSCFDLGLALLVWLTCGLTHAVELDSRPAPETPPPLEFESTNQIDEPSVSAQKLCYQTALAQGGEIEACNRALAETSIFDDRGRAAAYTNRALIRSHSDDLEAALFDIERALEILPNEPALLVNRGNLLWRLRRYEEASGSYQGAIDESNGRSVLAYYNRMFVHRVRGNIDLANRDLETAVELLNLESRIEPRAMIELPVDSKYSDWQFQQ